MSYIFDTRLGEQLYKLLPEVYRTRDKMTGQADGVAGTEDLAKYLDAHGYLLDLIHASLQQQLKDTLPESSQDWLLPYFAQLLAVNIVSPDSAGKHAEVVNAVSWRQRKGTLKCAEEIAEAIGQMEAEIQEGWQRVAMTPRIDMPLMPIKVWDDTLDIDMTIPSEAIRHPSLPVAMVDLRRPSRAVETKTTNPAARLSSFGGIKQTWRQQNRHGVPCFPGSFDDVSRRTVDIRTPDSGKGHYHHKRLLAYAPPPVGMFPLEPIHLEWTKRNDSLYEHLIEEKVENGVLVIRNKTERILVIHNVIEEEGVEKDMVKLEIGKNYRVENIHFSGTLLLEDGQLELHQVEAEKVKVDSFSTDVPVLIAKDCLFNELSVGSGIAELDSCTVQGIAELKEVDVNDCILMQVSDPAITGSIQYTRIPEDILSEIEHRTIENCVSDLPDFFNLNNTLAARSVLDPNTPESIYAGASDGGEMGYFHHGRKGRPVIIKGNFDFTLPATESYPLTDVIFVDNVVVSSGSLELERSAVKSLTINTPLPTDNKEEINPALNAIECLFDTLTVPENLSRLEYCTVMQEAVCKYLQASDCIFVGAIKNIQDPDTYTDPPSFLNCIRYSNIPVGLDEDVAKALRLMADSNKNVPGSNTLETPFFHNFDYCTEDNGDWEFIRRSAKFGESGYGVLAPATSDAIRFGAEDGGEMGAYHHKYYSLKWEAVLDKMREFLPVGIEPILIQDTRLLRVPPETKNLSNGGTI
jgi:hypothetical protein